MEETARRDEQPAIVIDKEGAWFYNGLPIINRQIVQYFYTLLEVDPHGGYQLRNAREMYPVTVQDAPFVVTDLWPSDAPPEQLYIKLSDETVELLDLKTLVISAANIPYCTVKQGRFRARFLRAPYYRLAEAVQQEDDTTFFIELNAQRYYLTVMTA